MIAASVLACLLTLQQPPKVVALPTEANLVGEWKALPATFKFVINEKGKADLKKQGAAGESEFKLLQRELQKVFASMKLTFQADHVFLAQASESPDPQKGKWTLKGLEVLTKMDVEQSARPVMKFSKDFKKIGLSFTIEELGTGTVDLERHKPK